MSGILNFHRLAAARGDGLHPKLLELLERREALTGSNPDVVEIDAFREGAFTQAGPGPTPKTPDFLPGNVVGFKPKADVASAARRKTSTV